MRARSIRPSRWAAAASISGWAAVSSRSITQVSTANAPRVCRSWATAVRRSLFRATSMKCAFCATSRRIVATAMLEVAPNIRTPMGTSGSRLVKTGYPLPKAGAERRIDISGKLLPLRIELLEVGSAHAGIFGGIHAAAKFGCDIREPIEQSKAHFPPDRKIERQGDARYRKRH